MAESPKWKKPSDVMKIRRVKKRATTLPRPVRSEDLLVHTLTHRENKSPAKSRKRKNPFGCSPSRRKPSIQRHGDNTDDLTETKEGDSEIGHRGLLDVLNKEPEEKQASQTLKLPIARTATPTYKQLEDIEEPLPAISQAPAAHKASCGHADLPQDWSLKMKARFISFKPFHWAAPLKTLDEANGISNFLLQQAANLEGTCPSASDSPEVKAEMQRCSMYWMHPNLPWLKLYPRIVADNKIGKASAVLQDQEVLAAMMSDWTESFTSVFHSLRAKLCPYFYVCTHQFTVGFFSASDHGIDNIHALVTPTSRGFREALKGEGIEFSMPLHDEKLIAAGVAQPHKDPPKEKSTAPSNVKADRDAGKSPKPTELKPQEDTTIPRSKVTAKSDLGAADENEEEEDDIENTDEGASEWLQTLGLDKRQYRSLDPNKVKKQRELFRVIDNRPESTVLVQGPDTQALFNYLLNCRSCLANTGVQAGIPPTLLSPSAFKGATLKSLQVKQSCLHHHGSEESRKQRQAYLVELTGPILPQALLALSQLFRHTQGNYTASFSVHEPTNPFNIHEARRARSKGHGDEAASELLQAVAKQTVTLRELTCEEMLFNWPL